MGLTVDGEIEEIRDRNGNVARPAADETLAEQTQRLEDAIGGGGTPVFVQLGPGESVSVPTGKLWDITIAWYSEDNEDLTIDGQIVAASAGDTSSQQSDDLSVLLPADTTITTDSTFSGMVATISGREVDQ